MQQSLVSTVSARFAFMLYANGVAVSMTLLSFIDFFVALSNMNRCHCSFGKSKVLGTAIRAQRLYVVSKVLTSINIIVSFN